MGPEILAALEVALASIKAGQKIVEMVQTHQATGWTAEMQAVVDAEKEAAQARWRALAPKT